MGFVAEKPASLQGFERDSLNELQRQGPTLAAAHVLTTPHNVRESMPGLNRGDLQYAWGYVNPNAGWAQSSRVLSLLLNELSSMPTVRLVQRRVKSLIRRERHVVGVLLDDGKTKMEAPLTIVCCGAWTRFLVHETRALLTARAMPVWHLAAPRLRAELVPPFPVCLDIGSSGFYVFPIHPLERVVKFGHHGAGYVLQRPATRRSLEDVAHAVKDKEEARLRTFLQRSMPQLAACALVDFHMCQYCDSHNGDFVVDWVPGTQGLVVACGGSGHGFKFLPVIGDIVVRALRPRARRAHIYHHHCEQAATVEQVTCSNAVLAKAQERFRWRDANITATEAARASL